MKRKNVTPAIIFGLILIEFGGAALIGLALYCTIISMEVQL